MGRIHKIIIIGCLIIIISVLHFTTHVHQPILHLIHRELYFLPVVLASLWFGKRSGMTVAVICILLYLPRIILTEGNSSLYYFVDNIIELVFYFLTAYFVGAYHDIRVVHFKAEFKKPASGQKMVRREGHKVLLFINDSENGIKAASYLADTIGRIDKTSVTILGVVREPSDIYSSKEEWESAKRDDQTKLNDVIENVKKMLVAAGIPEGSVTVKTHAIVKGSIVEQIIEEQQNFHYDTILMGGTKMSKTEEFVLGNISVKLVREAIGPIITVF